MKPKQSRAERQISDILDQLSYNQQRFLIARLESDTDAEAANKIGIDPTTVGKWIDQRELIKRAMTLVSLDAFNGAWAVIRRHAIKAAMVKAKGLDSKDERIAQQSAKEILEWVIDLPVQPVDWRENARENGYDPDQLYQDMVSAARRRLVEQRSGGSLGGSDST